MNNDTEPPLITILVWIVVLIMIALEFFIVFHPRKTEPYEEIPDSYVYSPNISYYPQIKYRILASVSGYSKKETCPYGECITASGQIASKHLIACPYWIPLGSRVEIEGVGNFTCGDRTAKYIQERFGPTFDIWFYEYEDAIKFGRQQKLVIVKI